jgi:hypothetical protein
VAAFLCDGIDGMVVDAARMDDELIRRVAAIRSDGNIMVDLCLHKIINLNFVVCLSLKLNMCQSSSSLRWWPIDGC